MSDKLPSKNNPDENESLKHSASADGSKPAGVTNVWMQQLNIFNDALSADQLRELNSIHPNFGKQFLENVLSETQHRRKLELRGQWMDFVAHISGQIASLAVVLALVAFSIYAIVKGSEIQAVVAIIGIIAFIVLTLMLGKKVQHVDNNKESHNDSPPAKK